MSDQQSETTSLTGKIALVTGAGSGVGQAVAIALAGEGMLVALAGRRRQALDETAALIQASGGRSIVVAGDVAEEAAVAAIVNRTLEAFGRIDAVICSAGIGIYGSLAATSQAAWQRTLDTNLTGVFQVSKAVLPVMSEQGSGLIVAISSGAGKQGYAGMTAYSAAKFGLMGFMQALAAEAAPLGIKVSTIVPGSVLTGFGGRSVAEKQTTGGDKKYLLPADVAEAVLFLLRQDQRAWTQELNLWPF